MTVQQFREESPAARYIPTVRRTRVSHAILAGVLCMQAVMSLRLRNTAFEDEALYLYAGHAELEHLLHGTALQGNYAPYFSGSPVLYPLAAAAVASIGGIGLVRAISLVEMLAVTALLYSVTRAMFNERVGLAAAALFAAAESTIFLGNFATFDATCLLLLAAATWFMVRSAIWPGPWFLAAAPLAALAVATKYTGLLFVPTIAVLPLLAAPFSAGRPGGDVMRRRMACSLAFCAIVGGLLDGAIWLGGPAYRAALESTTTNRAQGATPVVTVLRESAEWGGLLFCLAVVGVISYVRRVKTDPHEQIAPPGTWQRRAILGVVLVGTALLAPLYQAHLHTDISLQKHVGFGLFFAAPLAGFGLIRITGDYFRRPHIGIAVWCVALTLGLTQSYQLYHEWPPSGQFVTAFGRYLKPNAQYLVEVPEVPIYYLETRPDAQPDQFTSTYFISYTTAQGQMLAGNAGFAAAIRAGYFQVVAYNGDITPAADQAIAQALRSSRSYRLAAVVPITDSYGPSAYDIWVKN
jgi:4-amino-4-deoxy-L-arabinose transferase-like glycosyltransferase